jgi:hypothetical protein
VRKRRREKEKFVDINRKRKIKGRKRGRKYQGTRADNLLKSIMHFTSHRN